MPRNFEDRPLHLALAPGGRQDRPVTPHSVYLTLNPDSLCSERGERMENEWGKRCPACRYEHYPHLPPAVIVLVRDGDRVLLARKSQWAPGRYALVAGVVDNGGRV